MSEDSWEARMAQRAAERAATKHPSEDASPLRDIRTQQPWMHGWARFGAHTVLMGTATRCVCCGSFTGTTTVAFTEDWTPPGPDPDWPFFYEDCPLCLGRSSY